MNGAGLLKSDDRLNLSVEISTKQGSINRNLDNNLRLSRISEEKLNISVDGISSARNKSIMEHNEHLNMSQMVGNVDDEKYMLRGNQQKQSE